MAALLITLLAIGSTSSSLAQARPGSDTDYFVPSRILVKFKSGTPPAKVLQLVSQAQAQYEDQIDNVDVLMLKVPPGLAEHDMLAKFKLFQEIEFAELDYWRPICQSSSPQRTPSDPQYSNLWHLTRISAPIAWNTTIGSPDLKIAILDTGVDATHPDLVSKVVAGWNFFDNNADTNDVNGHGTAVAGTAAAATDNGTGIASISWSSVILPVRVSDANGWASDSTIANGLTWAADQGARVANISYNVSTSSTVSAAAQYFLNKGGVVAVSSGNDGAFVTNVDNPYMLTVGATDNTDTAASWSNTGNNVDLVAPGVNIYSTNNGGAYGLWTGTSFSAPIVAGAAALVMSANPNLSGEQVQNILRSSTDDLGTAGWDATYGTGRLNVAQAIGKAVTADTTLPTISITYPTSGLTVTGIVGVKVNSSDNIGVVSVTYKVDGVVIGTAVNAPFDFSWSTAKTAANGIRVLTAVASDAAGNTATASVTVTVKNSDGTRPTVKILAPVSRSIVSGVVTVQVSATDNNMVASVSLSINSKVFATLTQAPFTFSWDTAAMLNDVNTYPNGSATLLAKATDGIGNYSTASISVTVSNADTIAPTVTITSPADGTKTAYSKLSIYHSAKDNQKVTKVELYIDGVLKSSSTSSPFTLSYSVLYGTHKLQSRALDAKGNYGWSNIINVTR